MYKRQVFDLFVNLGATDEQLDFPIIYASALNGAAGLEHEELAEDMTPLFEAIVQHLHGTGQGIEGYLVIHRATSRYGSFLSFI